MARISRVKIKVGELVQVRLLACSVLCCILVSLGLAGLTRAVEQGGRSTMPREGLVNRQMPGEEVRKLEVFDFREKGLLQKFADLELDIDKKKQQIEDLEKNISSLRKKSAALAENLNDMRSQELLLEKRLSERLVCLYKYARKGYMRALYTARDLDEFRRRAKYLALIMAQDYAQLQNIFVQRHEISEKLEKIKVELSRTDALMRAQMRDLAALKEEVDKEVIQLMRIHEEKKFYETAARELARVGPKFKETIVKVEDRKGGSALQPINISSLKGRLPVPLIGTVIRGKRLFRSKRVHLNKGVFIRGSEGEEVRAILPGRVEFSGRLKGYGQVIIINHGSRFFTISALLSEREKQEGDLVKQGEVIGRVGSVMSGIGPSLYFEIREGGRNLDPLKWLRTKG